MIVYLRSANIEHDSRLQKSIRACDVTKTPICVFYWNRKLLTNKDQRFVGFSKKAGYGKRFFNAFSLLAWTLFLFKKLCSNRQKITTVQAIDFDTAIPGFIFSKVFKKKFIYEIYDKYTDSRNIKGVTKSIVDFLDSFLITRSSKVILVDSSRLKQHAIKNLENVEIIENVPDINCSYTISRPNDKRLSIGYFGGLEAKHRGLENVLQLVKANNDLVLNIAGFGMLEKEFNEASVNIENVNYHGPMSHHDGMTLMANSDVLLGLYYLSVPNHKYAAPNKYYEHLALGKPLLTSANTPPGFKVTSHDTGWAVSDELDSLEKWYSNLIKHKEDIKNKGLNAKKIWDLEYSDYFDNVYCKKYINLLLND